MKISMRQFIKPVTRKYMNLLAEITVLQLLEKRPHNETRYQCDDDL